MEKFVNLAGECPKPDKRTSRNFMWLLCGVLLLIGLVFSLASCHTAKKQFAKAEKTFNDMPKDAAKYCGAKLPVKSFTRTKIKTVQGVPDTTIVHDTTYVTVNDTRIKTVYVTKTIQRTDTTTVHDTTVVENTAVIEGLHYELTDSKAVAESATANAVKWRDRALWTWGILAALVVAYHGYRHLRRQYA